MGELLPNFDGKFEIVGCSFGPTLGSFGVTRAVESGVDLNGIEVSRIKLQLIRLQERIKESRPGAGSRAGRIAPSAGTNADSACGILRFLKKVSRYWIRYADFFPGLRGSTGVGF